MKKLTFLLLITFFAVNAYSAFLKNVPVDLEQPNGTVIQCFIAGDEFHRRVYDKDNYTIVQNLSTGYYVYALLDVDELKPSEYIVGFTDPKTLPLEPGVDSLVKQIEKPKESTLKAGEIAQPNFTKGNFNNIVISIRFSDQSPTKLRLNDYENRYNSTSSLSKKSYFSEVSNAQLNVNSYFFPRPQGQTILEFQDSHPRAYYVEYNAITNPIGFKEGERQIREDNLFGNAIESVKDEILNSQVNYDLNNDGFIDNITFVIQGSPDGWANLLFPCYSSKGQKISIGNKQTNAFDRQLSYSMSVSVLCHEFFHALGAPDLYHYDVSNIDPIGYYDIVGGNYAVHMTTFMKWKYGKWFNSIPEITQPGTYTLLPVSKSPFACYKIASPDNPNEYFMIEYRKREGMFETEIPQSMYDGIIIYRINTLVNWGNAHGPPDEVYIYRSGGTTSINGDITKATLSSTANRTIFNNISNPSVF